MTLTPESNSEPAEAAGAAGRRLLFGDWRLFLALGGGAGLVPKMPGTAGTALALPLYVVAVLFLPMPAVWLLAVVFCAGGVWLCDYADRRLPGHDNSAIVWDEIAACFLLLCFLPDEWLWQLAGFALFRVFDIWKPFPVRWIDKKVGGGLGVMLDDLAAAVLAGGCLWLLMMIM